MGEVEQRRWTAPDGVVYQLRVTEQMTNEGPHLKRVRRIHFDSLDGRVTGTVIVPGYFMLDLATGLELYDLWRRATGS